MSNCLLLIEYNNFKRHQYANCITKKGKQIILSKSRPASFFSEKLKVAFFKDMIYEQAASPASRSMVQHQMMHQYELVKILPIKRGNQTQFGGKKAVRKTSEPLFVPSVGGG